MTPWVYPAVCDDHEIEAVRNACIEGGTSCFTTGIDPGFANDLFPLTVMGVCGRVDSVRIQEILNYDSYTGSYEPMGFGKPLDHRALLETTDILVYAWGRTIPMIADAMGIELDGIDSIYDKWEAPADIPTAQGAVPAGTCGAVRFEIRGMVAGKPRIVIEHVNRMGIDAAPDWPRGSMEDNDVYRIEIAGSPNVTQETAFRRERDGDPNGGGCPRHRHAGAQLRPGGDRGTTGAGQPRSPDPARRRRPPLLTSTMGVRSAAPLGVDGLDMDQPGRLGASSEGSTAVARIVRVSLIPSPIQDGWSLAIPNGPWPRVINSHRYRECGSSWQ